MHGARAWGVVITFTAWLVPQRAASGAEATKKQARSYRELLGPLSAPSTDYCAGPSGPLGLTKILLKISGAR